MALVRVYCGLASADPTARPASADSSLTAAVVDDAGRLLHVCEIADDPLGYARLGALLVERSGGPSGAAIAADSDDHTVTSLLSAAGRPLAIADDDSVDDFAERFADDESLDEMQSPPAERRAVGLARALQAGALSAVTLPAPRDLAGYKSVLAAHAALANGRHSAAVALREVLRELYPAALRAYPDPAEPVSLAVLDALPEPGMLAANGSRGRDTAVAADAIAAHLAADGVADAGAITEAVTALRVAIAETPRRPVANKAMTSAIAETVRQAVAAVRACDAGCDALVATLTARVGTAPSTARRSLRRAPDLATPASAPPAVDAATNRNDPLPGGGRRSRPEPAGRGGLTASQPMTPVAPTPVAPPPMAPAPVTPAAAMPTPATPPTAPSPLRTPPAPAPQPAPLAPAAHRGDVPANRPISAPPPPPGITPIGQQQQRGKIPPAEAGEPFRATLTTAAIQNARAERQRPTPITPRPRTKPEPESASAPTNGFGATDLPMPVPTRPGPEPAPPGSRANWPLVTPSDERPEAAGAPEPPPYPGSERGRSPIDAPTDPGTGENRITPPWLADDLPQEPPMLRLVEPPPLADRALRENTQQSAQLPLDAPPLRLVEPNGAGRDELPTRPARPAAEHSEPPVPDEGDGDLLIFAAARSAWFTDHPDESEVQWSSTADTGWRAAEQAARPAVGAETSAGLPKRVPQANLVPGSPLRDERPLRIVRDPASLAENTTGYFRGWRRGQEIGGFAVGGRPGRESAGGWDFSRDPSGQDESREFEFPRSAGYRS
ncbi:transposase [Micromonospora sp. NPDC049559]|uniref:transposase n=1 Tax=Micromonospora sp. NPDC049559 TaxID=3155923 RepID=UPI003414D0FD